MLGIWTFVSLVEASTLCILLPFTPLGDGGGQLCISLPSPRPQGLVTKCTLIPLLLFLLTEKKYVLIERST